MGKEEKSFKDRNMDLQRIVWEFIRIRNHNTSFTEDNYGLFFFAEGLLIVLALERFLRLIVRDSNEKDSLRDLLNTATSNGLIKLPYTNPKEGIDALVLVRNALLHGNFEQVARFENKNMKEYFSDGTYITQVEVLFRVVNRIMIQIDPQTGHRRPDVDIFVNTPEFMNLRNPLSEECQRPDRMIPTSSHVAVPASSDETTLKQTVMGFQYTSRI